MKIVSFIFLLLLSVTAAFAGVPLMTDDLTQLSREGRITPNGNFEREADKLAKALSVNDSRSRTSFESSRNFRG